LSFVVSSPLKTQSDESVPNAQDEEKEKEDYETLRIYDGNSSLRKQVYRTATLPKTASVQQIRDVALRRFHISGEEELLEDPVPLRNVRRPEGRRAQIFLRYKDDPEKAVVKLYGGWLRVPVTFCSLTVTKETLVQDAIAEALDRFGLDRSSANRYNLIEVSLDRGVAERTANPHENMLQLVRNLRKEKDDPHDHAVFVGNLPVSLAQRQYERILLRLLGAKG
ncbi:unnamed protein product, partial [Gongylonema pulchrum]|uniref:Ras-associating domain-containing protein n=1 Tax=Gongylonema pulchrum TaxID=637853 RepID=A0A183D2N2_9BILA